jgi:hypothetical protein
MALRRHPAQRRRIVHPQPHALSTLGEVAGEAPAHADVAEVVDDAAEHVPQQGGHRRGVGRRRHRGDYAQAQRGCQVLQDLTPGMTPGIWGAAQ